MMVINDVFKLSVPGTLPGVCISGCKRKNNKKKRFTNLWNFGYGIKLGINIEFYYYPFILKKYIHIFVPICKLALILLPLFFLDREKSSKLFWISWKKGKVLLLQNLNVFDYKIMNWFHCANSLGGMCLVLCPWPSKLLFKCVNFT